MMQGEIREGRGGLYTVRDDSAQEHVLRAKKKFRRDGLTPLPGDRVLFTPRSGEEHGWLEEILPRSSLCVRPPVANVGLMVIVLAPEPVPDLLLADKLLLTASLQDIEAVIAVNKSDLGTACHQQVLNSYAGAGAPVLAVSAYTGLGLEALGDAMRGRLSCFAGQSGVGKSALLSRLMCVELVSGQISERIGRGRQTTRHTTLLYRDGLKVMDTPGFSLLDLPRELEPEEVRLHYPEYAPYAADCRFQPCLHLREPGCAVREAQRQGLIDPGRTERYSELMDLVKTQWRERYD